MRKTGYSRALARRAEADPETRLSRNVAASPKTREAGSPEAALATAIQYVVSRPRTAHEVRQQLARRGVQETVIASVLAQLQERGLLDDVAYAKAYLRSRLTNRGYGPQRLGRELQQRGVGRALIDDAMQHNLETDDVLAAARAHATKRWTRLAREDDPAKRRQKVFDFLRRRGFAAAIVQQVLTELSEDRTLD